MTSAPRRTVRRGRQHQPPSNRFPRSFQSRPSRLPSQPSLHNDRPDQPPPTLFEVPSYSPHYAAPAPPPPNMRVLDTLIDTRKLSIAELDRLQDAIDRRDAGIEGQKKIIAGLRRDVSKLDQSIATKQKTIDNQRTSNAHLHVTLDKARQENLNLRKQLKAEKERSMIASVAPANTSRLDHGPVGRRKDTNLLPKATHGVLGHAPSDKCLARDTSSCVADTSTGGSDYQQRSAVRERGILNGITNLKEREQLLQEQLDEALAVITISQAKLPELLEKSKRLDQLVAELQARDTALEDSMQSRVGSSARSHDIDAIQNLPLGQNAVIQRYMEQIQDLTDRNADQKIKAGEAVLLGRRMVDLIFASIPWQYVNECLPELQEIERQFTAALWGLSV